MDKKRRKTMTLVGKKAPLFRTKAVHNSNFTTIDLESYLGKRIVVLFFYPLDFTFVCPTELLAFNSLYDEFEKREATLMACSVDSEFSHNAWMNTPVAEGGIEGVQYPIMADINKKISTDYEVLNDDGIAFRALFIIDKKGIIRHATINDLFLGRSVQETLRTVDALIHHENFGEVCPANWNKGDEALEPNKESLINYLGTLK